MSSIVGQRSSLLMWSIHAASLALVVIWLIPTLGILVTSFRDKDQIAASGWWTSFGKVERSFVQRSERLSNASVEGDRYVLRGNVFDDGGKQRTQVRAFGWKAQEPSLYSVGTSASMRDGETLIVEPNGDYVIDSPIPFSRENIRIFYTALEDPAFTSENYETVLFTRGLGQSFLNTMTVTIPATVIPVLVAAFCAYALAWMPFRGRAFLLALIVGLLVVPLQLALIPLLRMYNDIGMSKSYMSIWFAHTGFGLPLAVYLLYNYIVKLPRELIESARVDGANDFTIFIKIILPLSFPALASFSIFQFLWVWNDLLVATVFLGNNEDELVMTGRLRELLGSFGGNWEIMATSAFVTITVPLLVFFLLQRYLVRGLLAGSVKGG